MEQFNKKQWVLLWGLPLLFFLGAGIFIVHQPRRSSGEITVVTSKVPPREDLFATIPAKPVIMEEEVLPSYVVMGAGVSDVNGEYYEVRSGRYRNANGVVLLYTKFWHFIYKGEPVYKGGRNSLDATDVTWRQAGPGGILPVPTVIVAPFVKRNIIIFGAGDEGVNGEYQYHAIGYPFGGGEFWSKINGAQMDMMISSSSGGYYIEDGAGVQYYGVKGDVAGNWFAVRGRGSVPTAVWMKTPTAVEAGPAADSP